MSTMSEQAREKAKAKVARLTSTKAGAVDASGWKNMTDQKGDVQTSMRPLSRRQYKKGGKVMGAKAEMRADRAPRAKGGGIVDDLVNVEMKKANQLRDGEKQDGGLKSGGRAKRAEGGPVDDTPVPPKPQPKPTYTPQYSRKAVQSAINQSNRSGRRIGGREAKLIHALLKGRQQSDEPDGYATGGRTGKMMGGPMLGRPVQRPVMPTAATPTGIRPQIGIRPMMRKAGGKVHEDAAEDKKLIKQEMHKAGCACEKCSGGKVEKKAGGSIDKLEGLRDKGGREARARGGRTKKAGMNVNIIIAQKPDAPAGLAPRPMGPPPGAPGPVGLHQGAPPPQVAAPAPMQPAPMMRKSGGRAYPIKTGGGGGEARLAKIRAYG